MMLGLLVAATTAAAAPLTLRSGDATLAIEPATLSLTLSINGTLWLAGGAFTRDGGARLAPADGLFLHTEPTRTSGADALGAWSGYNFSWTNGNGSAYDASTPTWLTSVRAYSTGGRIVSAARRPRCPPPRCRPPLPRFSRCCCCPPPLMVCVGLADIRWATGVCASVAFAGAAGVPAGVSGRRYGADVARCRRAERRRRAGRWDGLAGALHAGGLRARAGHGGVRGQLGGQHGVLLIAVSGRDGRAAGPQQGVPTLTPVLTRCGLLIRSRSLERRAAACEQGDALVLMALLHGEVIGWAARFPRRLLCTRVAS